MKKLYIVGILLSIAYTGAYTGLYAQADAKTTAEYIEDLNSEDDAQVIAAAKALGAAASTEATDPLIQVAKTHENPRVRISAASNLGLMGTKEQPTTALSEIVQSDIDDSVVYAALLSILNLADLTNPSAKEAVDFCETNKSDDPYIKDVVDRINAAMSGK